MRACIFCGVPPPLTAEHVWSQWLATEVPDLGHFGTEITGIVGDRGSFRRQRRKPSSVKPKIVCVDCNTGWMSQLQERAKPHLVPLFCGQHTILDREAQECVASWLAMTVYTASWAKRDHGGWAIPQDHRTELYATGRPSPRCQIWIAPCSHDDRPAGMPAFGLRYRLIRLDHLDGATATGVVVPARPAYAAAMSVGNLAALVFGHTYDPPIRPLLGFTGVLQLALKQVWPVADTDVAFPIDAALNYDHFNELITGLARWQ